MSLSHNEFLALLEARKDLNGLLAQGRISGGSNAMYSIIKQDSNGELVAGWAQHRWGGCYGSMSGAQVGGRYIIVQMQRRWENLSEETEWKYLDYLFHRSPFAFAYITKDPSWALKTGNVIVDGDVPGNMMMLAMISVRHLWEANYKVGSWRALIDEGVNEDLAYLMGHGLSVGTGVGTDNTAFVNENSHSALYIGRISYKFVKRFLEHDLELARKDTYFRTGQYSGVADSFQKSTEAYGSGKTNKSFRIFFHNLIREAMAGAVGKSKYVSPFIKTFQRLVKDRIVSYKLKDVAKALAKHQPEIFKEVGYAA